MTATKKHLYAYKLYTVHGKLTDGQIRHKNAQWARHQIRKQSLHIHSIKKVSLRPFSRYQNPTSLRYFIIHATTGNAFAGWHTP